MGASLRIQYALTMAIQLSTNSLFKALCPPLTTVIIIIIIIIVHEFVQRRTCEKVFWGKLSGNSNSLRRWGDQIYLHIVLWARVVCSILIWVDSKRVYETNLFFVCRSKRNESYRRSSLTPQMGLYAFAFLIQPTIVHFRTELTVVLTAVYVSAIYHNRSRRDKVKYHVSVFRMYQRPRRWRHQSFCHRSSDCGHSSFSWCYATISSDTLQWRIRISHGNSCFIFW